MVAQERERAELNRQHYEKTGTRGSELHVQEKCPYRISYRGIVRTICGKDPGVKDYRPTGRVADPPITHSIRIGGSFSSFAFHAISEQD